MESELLVRKDWAILEACTAAAEAERQDNCLRDAFLEDNGSKAAREQVKVEQVGMIRVYKAVVVEVQDANKNTKAVQDTAVVAEQEAADIALEDSIRFEAQE